MSDVTDAGTATDPGADPAAGTGTAPATAATTAPHWTARVEALPLCVLGALLLLGSLDPARWPDYLSPQWFLGAAAVCVGFWAGSPVVDRPVMPSFRLKHQVLRLRNTLLVAVSALLAALQRPPVWTMVVEVALLLTYLALIDAGAAPARPANRQLSQAACAYAASAIVLLAALAPITGGWWGRIVAALAVLGTLGLLLGVLRLRRPAGYPSRSAAEAVANARRH